MQQLTQQLKSGEMQVQEVPAPVLGPGRVMIRTHYSLISAGTEGSTVKTARKSMLGKAMERPEQVRQVLDVLQKQGPVQTYRAVMKKLDAYSPLGYSAAGEVIEVGAGVHGFSVGDKVACAGAGYANHAELLCVPVNLCVRLEPGTDLKLACYNTLGAIAMQGVRQADLRLGERCAVIGLGLIGQLTCLLLRAGGIKTLGIDVSAGAVATARAHCCDDAWTRDNPGLTDQIADATGGLGVDAVIITAATGSLDPINFAGQIARHKGRVVVVGAVPTGFERDSYYRKELELRMACSYGPGRYDANYEEKGQDYPAAYVRWTQNRNMLAFQELIHTGRIDLGYLTTHSFRLEESPKAYDMIVGRTEPFLGVVLEYDTERPVDRRPVRTARAAAGNGSTATPAVGVAFIGAGSYAQGNLLPNLPKELPGLVLQGVMTNNGTTSKRVAERFGFAFCTDDERRVLEDPAVNTIFIATRHDSHAEYVQKALAGGKHVFVEKPICLRLEELEAIEALYRERAESGGAPQLMVGFNRRFAPLAVTLKQALGTGPMAMIYRVNAGTIPKDTWIQDPEFGGGRIIGEGCHFIDFMTWLCGAAPVCVHAVAMPVGAETEDTISIQVTFANGSIGTLHYFANGSKRVAKEYFEVFQSGQSGILRDFKELEIHGRTTKRVKHMNQDKGQGPMVRQFLERVRSGGAPLMAAEEIFAVTRACFAAMNSLRERRAVEL